MKILIFTFLLIAQSALGQEVCLVLTNTMRSQRTVSEMVEVPLSQLPTGVQRWEAVTERGDTLPCQLTYDGLLIFPRPQMGGGERCRVVLRRAAEGRVPSLVHGRLYPERQSDFSFENDRVGYRIYGPGTAAAKERLWGYDIFLKRTPQLVLDRLYAAQCDRQMWHTVGELRRKGQRELADDVYQYGFCYHVDHGLGMDVYKVGPTLGAGTNALLADGNLVYPSYFEHYEVLDSGPLRLTLLLRYPKTEVQGVSLREIRRLTIDAGSQMVKAEITYEQEGADGAGATDRLLPVCGIVVHKENASAYYTDSNHGIIACEDLGDPDIYRKKDRERLDPQKGSTFIGCVVTGGADCRFVPFDKEQGGAVGHVLAVKSMVKGNKRRAQGAGLTLSYHFGHAWSRAPQTGITTMTAWQEYLQSFAAQQRQPVKLKILR